MGNRRHEVDRGIARQGLERLAVSLEGADAFGPRGGRWRLLRVRPVVVRPGRLAVPGIAAEFEDVVLGTPKVLHQLPRRVWQLSGTRPAELRRQLGHGGLEADMG